MTNPPPPAELEFLSDLIGAEATLRLIELHGGTRVHVPKSPNQGSKLSRDIGLTAAKALAARWGGDTLKVPLARYWRARIYRMNGRTYREIARLLGVNEGTVHTYLRAARMTVQQLDLFPTI